VDTLPGTFSGMLSRQTLAESILWAFCDHEDNQTRVSQALDAQGSTRSFSNVVSHPEAVLFSYVYRFSSSHMSDMTFSYVKES